MTKMRRIARATCCVVVSLASFACGDTGQMRVEFPAFGVGDSGVATSTGGWVITLDRADVGIGPIYFCTTASSDSELCPNAVVEFRASAPVDALSSPPQALGIIRGVTDDVRSAQYDYAISWLLTERDPTPTEGAVDGHSARFSGQANRGAQSVSFEADVDIAPLRVGTTVAQGPVTEHNVTEQTRRLTVELRAAEWFRNVDFDALLTGGIHRIEPGTQAYSAIVFGMTSTALPVFRWEDETDSELGTAQ